jgi:hypothetical protein
MGLKRGEDVAAIYAKVTESSRLAGLAHLAMNQTAKALEVFRSLHEEEGLAQALVQEGSVESLQAACKSPAVGKVMILLMDVDYI